uniref:DRBM domain-containing protein n=1 Tax=Lymnaea stagnalis TaxID=6523 RepID=A0A7S6WWN7_LYMST|nr:hypothetical protein [Lymnaea stagnalis]
MSDHSAALDESAMETSGAEESGTHVDVNEISNLDSHENEEDVSNNEDDYGDPGEEHEFEIIDQIESEEDDRDSGEKAEDDRQRKERENDDDYSTTSDELDDSELHAMLEKGIDKDSIKKLDGYEDGRPTIKHKIVLHELESDPFDILPEGWVCVTHNCGMPVYLHKETRVCTMARPYSLGAASARTHDIPVSAIPCLQYRRQMDKLKVEKGGTVHITEEEETANGKKTVEAIEPTVSVSENGTIDVQNSISLLNVDPASVQSAEKKSPAKVWVVTEESKTSVNGQHEALHTGVEDFTVLENTLIKPRSACHDGIAEKVQSPEGENIAVRLNSSACLDRSGDECLENSGSSLSCPVIVGDSDVGVSVTLSGTCPFSQSTLVAESTQEEVTLIEPEISRAVSPDPICIAQSVTPHISPESTMQSNVNVREEASGSTEPSELVTSNSNPLATIKRKIESLKNKRGDKRRKVDNGSAMGWPVENNVAVSALNLNNDDSFTASQNASANEKLKAHAAEVKIKSAEERAKESLLNSSTIHNYCTKLFQFKTLEVKKYRSWRERRKHLGERNRRSRPELPPSTKLITCPIPGNPKADGNGDNVKKREFILNPTGKSYLCILHEYMQRTLKIQPLYVFKELENSKTPYGATVMINNIEYGTGYASSKKVAKQEAAKETLKVLIPDLFKKITDQEIKRNISDLSFFDDVKVTDPRVNELGNKVGQPSPFQLLLECLRRNFGMGNTQCEVSTKPLKNQKCEFTINVGKHSATVVAKNKREGKQLAAQAILAKLHPHVPSWGSLLRLYGTSVEKPIQKPEEMNDVKSHVPNHSVLESLRQEMRKLHRQKEAIQSKGKIIISSKDLPCKMSGVDL